MNFAIHHTRKESHCRLYIYLACHPSASSTHSLGRTSPKQDDVPVVAAEESRAMMAERFAQLQVLVCNQIQQQLKNEAVHLDALLLYIRTLFSPGDCIPHTANVADIFAAITHNRLWDFLHHQKLTRIAQMFGGDDGEVDAQLTRYAQDLQGYKVATKVVEYMATVGEPSNHLEPKATMQGSTTQHTPAKKDQQYLRDLTIKLGVTVTKESLAYIDELWNSLSVLFLLPPSTAMLDKILIGSLYISWLIPTHTVPQIMERATKLEALKLFQQKNIEFIAISGIKVYTNKEEVVVKEDDGQVESQHQNGFQEKVNGAEAERHQSASPGIPSELVFRICSQ